MTTMNATVKDVMTSEVVVVRRGATFKEIAHVQGVVAVRDHLTYPDVYPILAGPVL
jgi:hypothetical protein